jgi:hypothetical protein
MSSAGRVEHKNVIFSRKLKISQNWSTPSFFRNFTFRVNSNPRVFKQSVKATKNEGAIETTYHFKIGCRILS